MSKFIKWLEKPVKIGMGLYKKDSLLIMLGLVFMFCSILMRQLEIGVLPWPKLDFTDIPFFLGIILEIVGWLIVAVLWIKDKFRK